jgi:Putative TM nitroreductase
MSEALLDSREISEATFPATGQSAEKLRFLVQYAILAPSSHNTQPWLFKIRGDVLELYADRTRALPIVDPANRALTISCGAALFHLRIALRHFRLGEFMSYAGPFAMRISDLGKSTAASNRQLATQAPVLAVLGTETDTAAPGYRRGRHWQGCCCERARKMFGHPS